MSAAGRTRPWPGRSPIARHGRLRSPRPAAALIRLLAVITTVVLVSVVSIGAIALVRTAGSIKHFDLGDAGQVPSIGAYSGAIDMLLVGSDTRDGQKGHYGSNPGSTLNDVNILLHVSADHSKATVISFPRDTYVNVPACRDPKKPGAYLDAETGVKLNSTLHYGGIGCVRDTVASLTGLKIPYVAMITFDGVVELSNAVGGVQVCVANRIDDDYTELHLSRGEHTLKGVTALKFLRTRHGVGDGSDLTRISSQQVFLSSLVRKLKATSTLTDITKLYGIATAAAHSMTLSSSLASPETIVSMARALAPVGLDKVVFVQYPTKFSGDGVVPNQQAAEVLMSAVAADRSVKFGSRKLRDPQGSLVSGSSRSPTPTPTTSASSTPTSSASASSDGSVALPDDVLGQTAAERSCSVGNHLGKR